MRSIVVRSTASNPLSESIGRITVADDSWGNDIKLYIAQSKDRADIQLYTSSSDRACQNWAGIEDHRDAGALALKAYIGGDLTGTILGATSTAPYSRLNTLQVEGTIGTKIYAHDGHYLVVCNEVPRLNGATAFWSDAAIGLIRALSGDIDCDVIANKDGSSTTYAIDWIDAPEGSIGRRLPVTPPNPLLIKVGTAGTANVTIKQLTAKHSINAEITAPQGIAFLKTTGVMVGDTRTEGDVTGTITTNKLINQLTDGGLFDIAGSLEAAVTLTAELPANAKIAVGKYLGDQSSSTSTPAITIGGNAQLKGNIVIDQFNPVFNQINWQLWNRPVVVERTSGNITLGPASDTQQEWYSQTSAQLGGGAVGLPPFNVNLNDCVPPGLWSIPFTQSFFRASSTTLPALLRNRSGFASTDL